MARAVRELEAADTFVVVPPHWTESHWASYRTSATFRFLTSCETFVLKDDHFSVTKSYALIDMSKNLLCLRRLIVDITPYLSPLNRSCWRQNVASFLIDTLSRNKATMNHLSWNVPDLHAMDLIMDQSELLKDIHVSSEHVDDVRRQSVRWSSLAKLSIRNVSTRGSSVLKPLLSDAFPRLRSVRVHTIEPLPGISIFLERVGSSIEFLDLSLPPYQDFQTADSFPVMPRLIHVASPSWLLAHILSRPQIRLAQVTLRSYFHVPSTLSEWDILRNDLHLIANSLSPILNPRLVCVLIRDYRRKRILRNTTSLQDRVAFRDSVQTFREHHIGLFAVDGKRLLPSLFSK